MGLKNSFTITSIEFVALWTVYLSIFKNKAKIINQFLWFQTYGDSILKWTFNNTVYKSMKYETGAEIPGFET